MATKTIKLDDSTAKKIYKTAGPELKAILEENFDKRELSAKVEDRIGDFDDILDELDKTLDEVVPYRNPRTKKQVSQNAYAKIQCITEVYNDGAEEDWTNQSQPKYFLYWERKKGGWVLLVVFDVGYIAGLGFGCYFLNRDHALHAAEKFKDIFIEWLPE